LRGALLQGCIIAGHDQRLKTTTANTESSA
jgi:hypothetical protein